MGIIFYNFRLRNFRETIKITSWERFFIQKLLCRFCKTATTCLEAFLIFAYLYVCIKVQLLISASAIEMLHSHISIMFSGKN